MTISKYNLHNDFVRPWPLILRANFGYHGILLSVKKS